MNKIIFLLFGLILSGLAQVPDQTFDYSEFDSLLRKFVHEKQVDYRSLIAEKDKLYLFTKKLNKISPDSHPDLFKTTEEKLAYWINAYNAFILKLIVENYPVDSIKDIKFIGFTVWFSKNTLGGEEISFKALEDDIIRDRFGDPRIHFAINCASASCPPLLNEAFLPQILDRQLDTMTAKFINDKSNVLFDEERQIIFLSSIFDWYEKDYTSWLEEERNMVNPTLLDYIKIYYDDEIPDDWQEYDIKFYDYDWSLNDFDQ